MAPIPCIAIHSEMIMAMAVTSCLADGLLCTETKFPRLSIRQGLINSTLLVLLKGQAGTENTLEDKFIARGKNADPSSGSQEPAQSGLMLALRPSERTVFSI